MKKVTWSDQTTTAITKITWHAVYVSTTEPFDCTTGSLPVARCCRGKRVPKQKEPTTRHFLCWGVVVLCRRLTTAMGTDPLFPYFSSYSEKEAALHSTTYTCTRVLLIHTTCKKKKAALEEELFPTYLAVGSLVCFRTWVCAALEK